LYENIILYILSKGEVKPAALIPIWSTFHETFQVEDKVYKRAAAREETALIVAAHERRKSSYMAAKRTIEAASYRPTPDIKAAADALLKMMENYSSAYYAPMNEASALFVNLIQDFAKENHAPQVALIAGAAEDIARLEEDNNAFMTLLAGRAYAEEEEKAEGNLREVRKETDRQFSVLVESINVFYHANEILPSKNAEVSAYLSDIITFINSYIHLHETTYARRNPSYTSGGNKPSQPDHETPSEPTVPSIPEFSISTQEVTGDSAVISGFGTQMTLRATDPQAFADVLYPVAQGGSLLLTYPETESSESFPIVDFLFDNEGATPVGLVVGAPSSYTAFAKPFSPSGDAEAEVVKDEQLLAILLDVQFPATMSEGR
jgi:hypothetical protein